MKKNKFGPLFIFGRFIVRCLTRRHRFSPLAETVVPAVYLVHHQNMKGPVTTMAWLPFPVRLWTLSVFCSPATCFRQYYDYTFTKRFGLPKALTAVLAFPLSYFVSALMKSTRVIPVYRDSKMIVTTFQQSMVALIDGESLLISPDVDYDSEDPDMGEMHEGFLDLEKFYWKQTGQHLAFIPLFINDTEHCIYAGQAMYFQDDHDFKHEKEETYKRLKQEFSRLASLAD